MERMKGRHCGLFLSGFVIHLSSSHFCLVLSIYFFSVLELLILFCKKIALRGKDGGEAKGRLEKLGFSIVYAVSLLVGVGVRGGEGRGRQVRL